MTTRDLLARELTLARDRTLRLVEFDDAELLRQYDPLMSPLVWDLAHIGWQEELWLLRGNDGRRPSMLPPAVEGLYDAFVHSRASRVDLPLLPPEDARVYCRTVRSKSLDALDALPPEDGTGVDPTFVFGLAVSHENQHDETMLQALNLRTGPAILSRGAPLPPGRPGLAGTSVLVPGGPFVLGVTAAEEPLSLDNERDAHVVDVPSFRIGRVPVTNAEWRDFIADGGYREPRWWSDRGWSHRQEADLVAPKFWNTDGTRTSVRSRRGHSGRRARPARDVFRRRGVRHMGGRAAAHGDGVGEGVRLGPSTGARRRFPWGASEPTNALANLGGEALRPASVGAYPAGASAYGAEQMLGDVWEWTTSPLRPWPGFTPMLYEQYSRPFFDGDYKILRGGAWSVAPSIVRPSFRNWDHPIRRQIFSGVRLAWDA